ncbi:hypothetical protein [Clostridium autoethanogenum]|uniref:Uncharacterized protein n=1 Tax=Clostridium autoethanogenum DSM 10061 TaxID=1341692 RepID=A0ABN4BQB5_9CLOT|nr:hypothetical protein [Clostridium autoethanogenum]AGY78217.1 hypothetical protein CAETHG_4016 [Clostridium autoethanogenum DSM 10061]ALU38349.1 Hypothetical protein CLAU_3922 [Clostridium autoethanogenum DSM 10061]OVY51112.1 hypothetical protein WX72_02274 [Clostridium autoethanogenum]
MYCNKKTHAINFLDLLALTDNIPIKSYVDYINLTKIKDSYIQSLINEIKSKNNLISYTEEVNSNLADKVSKLQNSIYKYENKIHALKINQISVRQEQFKIIYDYEKEISNLRCEKDTLHKEMNKKINSLLKIIEEKESMLSRLHELLYSIIQQL